MGRVQIVHEVWDALAQGDLGPLESVLAPDAKWRAVEDGPWNCPDRSAILTVMRQNVAQGLSGRIESAREVGDAVIVAFRPDQERADGWPLDDGIRYTVVTLRGDQVAEIKGCADRAEAIAYAG